MTNQRKKILLSAYACNPYHGSEPGVGWRWAIELTRLGYETWVITLATNQADIETTLSDLPERQNLHFLYCKLPAWLTLWKYGRLGRYLHQYLWQWGAYRVAKKMQRSREFDLVQHLTFASIRHPSFMGNLGIPFIFGPVGGGESAPWRLRAGYGLMGWLVDAIRDVSNALVRVDPLMRRTFSQANRIYVTSVQTLALLPARLRYKAVILLNIGCEAPKQRFPQSPKSSRLRILFVGRWLHWKGMHLGLPAVARLLTRYPSVSLTMIGKGPQESKLRRLAHNLGIQKSVSWIPWMPKERLTREYCSHDVFLFPSLHDSGGGVVLEALTHGLPVVCLKLGGPGEIVDASCGRAIDVAGQSKSRVIQAIADALLELAQPCVRESLAKGSLEKARQFVWQNVVQQVHQLPHRNE